MRNSVNVKLFFINCIILSSLKLTSLTAQPSPQDMYLLQELAHKYHGKHRVELMEGTVLKPDAVVEKDGFVEMFFKGNAQGENEFEQAIAYPLNRVRQIDDKRIGLLIANYQLANYFFLQPPELRKGNQILPQGSQIKSSQGDGKNCL